nr:hypothetical protein [uncultured Anaerotignum sp.]
MIKKTRRMKVRFCGLSIWQMDLSSGTRVPSFFFLKKKRHPCKFLSELQALMSLPEKEGFELSTSSAKSADDYAVPPLQNCNKGRSDSGFAVFSMGKEISFLFFASSARPSGSMLFLLNKKRHPCKFLLELQALMSLPEKEGFELSTSSAKSADDYAVPPLQNCNKGRSDSGFAVFSMGKEISFLFFASSPSLLLPPAAVGGRSHTARRSGSMLFRFETKKDINLS